MWTCRICATSNPDSDTVCIACRQYRGDSNGLDRFCCHCGAKYTVDSKTNFCIRCGNPLPTGSLFFNS